MLVTSDDSGCVSGDDVGQSERRGRGWPRLAWPPSCVFFAGLCAALISATVMIGELASVGTEVTVPATGLHFCQGVDGVGVGPAHGGSVQRQIIISRTEGPRR